MNFRAAEGVPRNLRALLRPPESFQGGWSGVRKKRGDDKIPGMRLWTVHPGFLDTKGLLAAWREALLAQKVLKGETRGYRNHPQLLRFKGASNPLGAIAEYLRAIHEEARRRGYSFDMSKIEPLGFNEKIPCTRGQLLYEWEHLKRKLLSRDAEKYREIESIAEPHEHPLFKIVEGEVEAWEIR